MNPNDTTMPTMPIKEVREVLEREYGCQLGNRRLHVTEVENSYSQVGSIHFSLEGSPPKGYATYIPESRMIVFYDHNGREFRREEVADLSGADVDNAALPTRWRDDGA